jgi:RNA polymerase sigma-70 factor, ECF subfamily
MLRELQFKYLSNRHADDVFRFALALLGNHADAEDAAQEVLIKLWSHLPVLTVGRMKTCMLTTTRHHCLDQLRKRQRKESVPLESITNILEYEDTDLNLCQPDRQAIHEKVIQALESLPENQRSAFALYEINGLKYHQIATTLNLPLNSVKVYISRARQNLQQQLKKESSWIKSYIDGSK